VVEALEMQQPVHEQVRVVRGHGLALRLRLAGHDRRADHDVALERLRAVDEREHVGRVVLAAIRAIEAAAFGFGDVADGHRGVTGKRCPRPLPDRRVRGNV